MKERIRKNDSIRQQLEEMIAAIKSGSVEADPPRKFDWLSAPHGASLLKAMKADQALRLFDGT